MSGTVNKVILVGRLGNDPEMRYAANGSAVANISLATNESWMDKQTGQKQERTEWHRVVFFNRTAEVAGEYLRKGSLIYVEGRLQTRKWQDQKGQDRYITEIVGNEMKMLGGRNENAGNYAPSAPAASNSNYTPPATPPAPASSSPASSNAATPPANAPAPENFDDDVPF